MKPPVIILCGGRGTRLRERTADMPKALVEIGGRPILSHVLDIFAEQGFDSAILATGYRGEMIEDYIRSKGDHGIGVECIDTGVDTPTGGRLWKLRDRVEADRFCVTYADGVANVDLDALLGFHRGHGTLATVTVVQPKLPWGVAQLDGDERVIGFAEKPLAREWINGGFFCFEPRVLEYLRSDSVLEREPLSELAAAGQLSAYRHPGFWECMDTYKDAIKLNDLCVGGSVPWLHRA